MGCERITRNAGLWAFGLTAFGLGACPARFQTEAAFYLGPLVTVAILGAHKDSRERRGGAPHYVPWPEQCHVPFSTVLMGEKSIQEVMQDLKWTNAAIGVGVTPLLFALRGRKWMFV